MIRTNIERQKRSYRRGSLRLGDIFGMHVPPKGWVFGRVIADGMDWDEEILVYIYSAVRPEPQPIPTLDKMHLLIKPFITLGFWIGRWTVTLERRPLAPGDRFERHCFRNGPNDRPYYTDEFGRRVPERFEPCGEEGITPIKALDDEVSEALGVPLIPEAEKDAPGPKRRHSNAVLSGRGSVTLYVPLDEGEEPVDADEVEDRLRKALARVKAGKWQGHVFDLAKHRFDATFEGPNARRLLAALRRAIQALKPPLPNGWYATVRYGGGDEERIEL